MHIHVSDGSQGGYMPDTVETFVTRREADGYAADLLRDYEDAADEMGEGIAFDEWSNMIVVTYTTRHNDLGRIIERWECEEHDC